MSSPIKESVKQFDTITHEGKKILISVMYMKEPAEAVQAIDDLAALVIKEPERSVRILLDVTEGKIFDESTARWKEKLPIFDKYVLKGAVVGPAWMRTITSAILMVARIAKLGVASRVKAFGTIAEARDYLVKD
jgi:hypothetical protein